MVVRRAYDKEFIFASLYPFVVDNSYTLPGWGSVGRAGAGWEEGRGGGLWQAACLPHLEHVGHVTSRWLSHTLIEMQREENRHAVRWMRKRRV